MDPVKTLLPLNIWLTWLIIASFFLSPVSAADWTGYINNKTLKDGAYGYMVNTSKVDGRSKLKLVCFPPDNFRLYLDDTVISDNSLSDIAVSVDGLPPVNLSPQRAGAGFTITNNTIHFWNLIAQMSAGAVFNLSVANNKTYRYSLNGFTKAYQDYCGWMNSANKYRSYLDRYQ